MQILDIILPAFEAPDWVLKVLILVLALGLPIALALAWSFDVKQEKTPGQPEQDRDTPRAGMNIYLIIVALAAVGYIIADKVSLSLDDEPGPVTQPAVTIDDKSLAIIPFKNLSANGENQYFSDGVMEAILNELSVIRDLKVVSRTSVEAYRDTTKSIRQIAGELEVAHILEGSVQRSGDKVRVTAQLIAAADDRHLWSRNYDRDLSDIFAIQSEIATAIASNLELILTSEDEERLVNAPTSELRAYDLYLRSQQGNYGYFLSERPSADARQALSWCQQARDLDPQFALAYTCIASNLFYLGKSEYIPLSEWEAEALENLDKALEINPRLWEAFALRADIFRAKGEMQRALRYTGQVLEINPNQPTYLQIMGFHKITTGDLSEGIDMVLRAYELMARSTIRANVETVASSLVEIAPRVAANLLIDYEVMESPSIETLHNLAGGALYERNYVDYLKYQDMINARLPTPNNQINLALAYLFSGNYERAADIYEQVLAQETSPETVFLKYPFKHRYAYCLMQMGAEERGLAMMQEYRDELLHAVSSGLQLHGNKGAYYDLAVIYSVLGEPEEAEKWLKTAAQLRNEGVFFEVYFVRGDAMLQSLQGSDFVRQVETQLDKNLRTARLLFSEKLAQRHREGKLKWMKDS
jgi:TolB-like protein/Flp pilus assembly protein TadD